MKSFDSRPYVICHMVQSVDGKVTGEFLSKPECCAATDIYYEINRSYSPDGFACGRVTMEGSFTNGWYPDLSEFDGSDITETDFVSPAAKGFYAVAFDRKGRLGWKDHCIHDYDPGYDKSHIVEVLCTGVDTRYLSYLQKTGVSYIFAGDGEMDIPLALYKLKTLFGINTLLLEGGSIINGAFEKEKLIDELSLVVAPVAADAQDKPLFYSGCFDSFELKEVKRHQNGVVWLNYTKK